MAAEEGPGHSLERKSAPLAADGAKSLQGPGGSGPMTPDEKSSTVSATECESDSSPETMYRPDEVHVQSCRWDGRDGAGKEAEPETAIPDDAKMVMPLDGDAVDAGDARQSAASHSGQEAGWGGPAEVLWYSRRTTRCDIRACAFQTPRATDRTHGDVSHRSGSTAQLRDREVRRAEMLRDRLEKGKAVLLRSTRAASLVTM